MGKFFIMLLFIRKDIECTVTSQMQTTLIKQVEGRNGARLGPFGQPQHCTRTETVTNTASRPRPDQNGGPLPTRVVTSHLAAWVPAADKDGREHP